MGVRRFGCLLQYNPPTPTCQEKYTPDQDLDLKEKCLFLLSVAIQGAKVKGQGETKYISNKDIQIAFVRTGDCTYKGGTQWVRTRYERSKTG